MKKNKVFFGLALLGIAFSGAAFTANKTMQMTHYIQKPGECIALNATTNCDLESSNPCEENDGTGDWQVFESQANPTQCATPLSRPD